MTCRCLTEGGFWCSHQSLYEIKLLSIVSIFTLLASRKGLAAATSRAQLCAVLLHHHVAMSLCAIHNNEGTEAVLGY